MITAVVVPLWVNLSAKQAFEPSKVFVLRSLVWLTFAFWLAGCITARQQPWRVLRGNRILRPALLLAAVLGLATIASVDIGQSLWGSYERGQGLLTLVSYILLFVVVSSALRTREQANRLVASMALTAVPLVALGLAQWFGWDYGALLSDARSPARATMGRANFLGAYLGMLLPFTVALALLSSNGRAKWLAVGLVVCQSVVLGITLSRAAWLSGGIALAAFALLWYVRVLPRRWFYAASATGGVALLGILVAALWLGQTEGSTAARLAIWKAAWQLVLERPALGFGPDNMGLVFPQVFPPELVYYQGRGVMIDRAHNLLLDWAVIAGVPGVLAWCAVLGAYFASGIRILRQTNDRGLRTVVAACLAAVAGNLAGNLVAFDTSATAMVTWFAFAVVAAVARFPATSSDSGITKTQSVPISQRAVVAVVLGATLFAVFQANARPALADVAAKTADDLANRKEWQLSAAALEDALSLWPFEPAHHQALSWAYLQRTRPDDAPVEGWFQRAEGELLTARDLRPGDHRVWWALGELYTLWGARADPARLDAAEHAFVRAVKLSPNNGALFTAWGSLDMVAKRLEPAVAKFQRAASLDATDAVAFSRLGDAKLALGRVDQALDAYGVAVKLDPQLVAAHLGMVEAYLLASRPQAAREILESLSRRMPEHPAVQYLRDRLLAEPSGS